MTSYINTENLPPNKYKNANGAFLTRGLFLETSETPETALYTLREGDWNGRESLRRIYLEVSDPTEYRFAKFFLDGWDHWNRLLQSPWFLPYIQEWRTELDLKIKSYALERMLKFAESNTKGSFEANKWLVDAGYKPGEGRSRVGRPSKDEIKRQAQNLFNHDKLISEDAQRLGVQ